MTLQTQTELMKHQKEAVQRAMKCPTAFAMLAETGCGKTLAVLAEWQTRVEKRDLHDLLVLAPAGSIRNWYVDRSEDDPCELRRHLDPKLLSVLLIADNRPGGAKAHAREVLLADASNRPRAFFVNIEALSMKDSKAERLCREFLERGRAMMVIDESTTIRHKGTARTKAVLRLGKLAKSRRILTGLVTPRSPLDLFTQFNFLDPNILGYNNFVLFRSRYAVVDVICKESDAIIDMRLRQACSRKQLPPTQGLTRNQKVSRILELGGWIPHIPMIKDYKNLGELREKIAPYSHQVLKSECLDLPPKVYEVREVPLMDEQRRVYNEVRADATAKLESGDHVTATTALAQITRLQQVACGHVRDEEGKIHDVPSKRVDAVLQELEEHAGKAVIWVTYEHELHKIDVTLSMEYGTEAVARFWGGNMSTRAEDERRFLQDPKCRFMIATSAGSRGNTWTVADLVIYAANSWDLEFRFQSEDRTHRIGQTRSVTYIDLVSPDTVDEIILRALRRKINLTQAITGETWRRWVI